MVIWKRAKEILVTKRLKNKPVMGCPINKCKYIASGFSWTPWQPVSYVSIYVCPKHKELVIKK